MSIVSFVILHYKDMEITDICVQSILRMDQQERIRIVVVDNDIQKCAKKREALKEKYRNITNLKVLQIKENGGFSYANNQGYMFAREKQGASFVIILNNDIEFTQKDFLERLDRVYEQNPCYVIGPDVVQRGTGIHQNPMDTRLRTKKEAEYTIRMNRLALKYFSLTFPLIFLQEYLVQRKSRKQNIKFQECYWKRRKDQVLFGACLIFTSDYLRKNPKAFWPETEFYYEEYILSYQCQKKGYTSLYEPSLKVLHESGLATKEEFQSRKKHLKFRMEKTLAACSVYRKLLEEK